MLSELLNDNMFDTERTFMDSGILRKTKQSFHINACINLFPFEHYKNCILHLTLPNIMIYIVTISFPQNFQEYPHHFISAKHFRKYTYKNAYTHAHTNTYTHTYTQTMTVYTIVNITRCTCSTKWYHGVHTLDILYLFTCEFSNFSILLADIKERIQQLTSTILATHDS